MRFPHSSHCADQKLTHVDSTGMESGDTKAKLKTLRVNIPFCNTLWCSCGCVACVFRTRVFVCCSVSAHRQRSVYHEMNTLPKDLGILEPCNKRDSIYRLRTNKRDWRHKQICGTRHQDEFCLIGCPIDTKRESTQHREASSSFSTSDQSSDQGSLCSPCS